MGKTIGENIKALREERGFTQEAVHKMTGIGVSYLSTIEQGSRQPGRKTIEKLCDAFTVDEQTLRYGERRGKIGLDERHALELRLLIEELSPLSPTEQLEWLLKIRKAKESQGRG